MSLTGLGEGNASRHLLSSHFSRVSTVKTVETEAPYLSVADRNMHVKTFPEMTYLTLDSGQNCLSVCLDIDVAEGGVPLEMLGENTVPPVSNVSICPSLFIIMVALQSCICTCVNLL